MFTPYGSVFLVYLNVERIGVTFEKFLSVGMFCQYSLFERSSVLYAGLCQRYYVGGAFRLYSGFQRVVLAFDSVDSSAGASGFASVCAGAAGAAAAGAGVCAGSAAGAGAGSVFVSGAVAGEAAAGVVVDS